MRQPIEFPVRYAYGPDSFPQPGVPSGSVHEYGWSASRVVPGTDRRYWLYVPAQYKASDPRDLYWDEPEYNWFSSNLRVAAALAERGYDLRFVVGDGHHSVNHGATILPDALRWLWRR